MESEYAPPKQSPPRKIVIENDTFGYRNIEAWLNIIRSYKELHPQHRVILLYHGETVQNAINLFTLGKPVDHDGFELSVAAPDQDFKHVAKLYRLLVEGAGPDYEKFQRRDVHQILKLF